MTDELLRATVTQRGVIFGPDEDILVPRRASDGGWELPGGRVGRSEDAVEGLRREIDEETAIDPDVVTPVETLVWRNESDDGRFAVYYYCRTSDRAVTLSPEHDDYTWGPVGEVRSRLSEPQQAAVDAASRHHDETPL